MYINKLINIFEGLCETQINSGTHQFPFKFTLPANIPSSFDGKNGSIEYKIEAFLELEIPWQADKKVQKNFIVKRIDNINDYPDLKISQTQEEVRTFCCFPCESQPCYVTISIPHTGYAAGQEIPITIDYINYSSSEILITFITLNRTFNYTSLAPNYKVKTETEKMVSIQVEGINEKSSRKSIYNLKIPLIMENSNSRFCSVIQICYFFGNRV